MPCFLSLRDVFVAVLMDLARCYSEQEMFTEAEGICQAELSRLKEKPEENKERIADGQTVHGWHHVLHVLIVSAVGLLQY